MAKVSVLVVGEDTWRSRRWTAWLDEAGFATSGCPGPHIAERCPRLDGERCALRELFDVAVIDGRPTPEDDLHGGWVEGVCTKEPDDGRTVFVEPPVGSRAGHRKGIGLTAPVDRALLVWAVEEAGRRAGDVPGRAS